MNFMHAQGVELCAFLHDGFSAEIKRTAIAFLALAVIGFGLGCALPVVLNRVMKLIFDYIGGLDLTTDTGSISAAFLFLSNLRACAVAILYGLIPFIFLSALPLGMNSMLLGFLAAYYWRSGHPMLLYFAALLPHGIFELPALILAAALGLFLCRQMTRRCRHDETALPLPVCLTQIARVFLLLIAPLLAVAAVMEAYVTPLLIGLFS